MSTLQLSKLSNGIKIASFAGSGKMAAVSLFIQTGSRWAPPSATSGVAHFVEHLTFKGTKTHSLNDINTFFESQGSFLNALTAREHTVYISQSFPHKIQDTLSMIGDIVTNSSFNLNSVHNEKDTILAELLNTDSDIHLFLNEASHHTSFHGSSMGQHVLGSIDDITNMQPLHLQNYVSANYTGNRMYVVGSGGISHDYLHETAEKALSHIPASYPDELSEHCLKPPTKFVGGDSFLFNSRYPDANFILAFESGSHFDKDLYVLQCLSHILPPILPGQDRSSSESSGASLRIANFCGLDSLLSFDIPYSDTGLFSFLGSCPPEKFENTIYNMKRIINSFIDDPESLITPATLDGIKSRLYFANMMSLDSMESINEYIGINLVNKDHVPTEDELREDIFSIKHVDIARVLTRVFKDKPHTLTAILPDESLISDSFNLPDYEATKNIE